MSGSKNINAQDVKDVATVQKTDFSEQSTWVLGYFARGQITRPPHSEWFTREYDGYSINQEALDKIMKIPYEGITIRIVMGTWCPDSRKQVPRFMKITDAWQFPESSVIFIGVDDAKLSPVGEYEKLDIQRVPTFIFYRNNIESGRIIENPLTSLGQDMVKILTGKD
ncbi:MAG: thioredoxin family protein [Bacteroidia bacterium]|nr:thioredoxin family protein [Bacteroidia bacterium]